MSAHIIDGKAVAARLREELATDIQTHHLDPGLAVILVGDDPASQVYVRNKIRACEKTGIRSIEHKLPAGTAETELLALIQKLNRDPQIHGILLQLPLPPHLDPAPMIMAINPAKDVDGLHPLNAGKLMAGQDDGMVPCTPQGAMILIREVLDDLSGKHAVVIGRSLLFGKPAAQLLLTADCTVTHCHSRTRDLPSFCRQADILIAAVGLPHMVKADWVKDGAVIIDVGINRLDDGTLAGDVDFEAVQAKAAAITPVPGGVGPMTIACLLQNTFKAAKALS